MVPSPRTELVRLGKCVLGNTTVAVLLASRQMEKGRTKKAKAMCSRAKRQREKKKKERKTKQLICFPLDEKVADEFQQDLASVHSFKDRSMVGDSLSNKTGEQTYFLEPRVVDKKKEKKREKVAR